MVVLKFFCIGSPWSTNILNTTEISNQDKQLQLIAALCDIIVLLINSD